MVADAAGFAHAGGGNDDTGAVVRVVESFRFGHRTDEVEAFEDEGIVLIEEEAVNGFVEALRVDAEDLCGVHGERAVDVDRHAAELAGVEELVEDVEELLGALDGESGDHHLAAALEGFFKDRAEGIGGPGRQLVLAAAVGAFHQDEIDVRHRDGIAQDFVAAAADVAGEEEALLLVAVFPVDDFEQHLGGTEDVAGVVEGQRHAVAERHRALVADADELAQAALGVFLEIEWLDGRQVVFGAVLVEPFGVLLLDMRAVCQHDLAEVAGGESGVDVAAEALLAEVREIAAVVDVGVGEDHDVDFAGVEVREAAVDLVAFLAVSLIEAAVEEDAGAVDFEQVLGSGGGAGGTAEFEFHELVRKLAPIGREGNGKVDGVRSVRSG